MENSILSFSFDQSTSIRAANVRDVIWFIAKDIAAALGYDQTANGLKHCKKASVLDELNKINGLAPATKWIPEPDMYRMVMHSTLPTAERFQDWVYEDVLPSIRKTGSYQLNEPPPRESMETINTADQEAIARIVWLIAGRFHFKGMAKHAIYTGIRRQYGLKNSIKNLPTCYLDDCYVLLKELDRVATRFTGMMYEHEKRFYHRVFRNLIPLDADEFERMFEQELTRIAIENRKTADLLEYFRPKPAVH